MAPLMLLIYVLSIDCPKTYIRLQIFNQIRNVHLTRFTFLVKMSTLVSVVPGLNIALASSIAPYRTSYTLDMISTGHHKNSRVGLFLKG